jgi:hypothetical protein
MKIAISVLTPFKVYFVTVVIALLIFRVVLSMEGFASLPYIRVMYGVLMLLLFLLLGIKYRLRVGRQSGLFYIFSCFTFIWFGVGVSNANIYVVTDLVYFIIFLLGYFQGLSLLENTDPDSQWCFGSLYRLSIFLTFAIVFLYFLGVVPYVPVLVFIASVALAAYFYRLGHWWYYTLLVVSIVVMISDLNRAFILQVVFVYSLFAVFTSRERHRGLFVFFIILSLFFLIYYNWGEILYILDGSSAKRRILETIDIFRFGIDPENSISLYQRVYEAKLVYERLGSSWFNIFFGFGFGPVLDMSYSLDTSVLSSQLMGAATTHNVHFLVPAILFRFGVIGLALYAFLLFFAFVAAFSSLRIEDNSSPLVFFACIYIIGIYVISLTASSFLFVDPLVGVNAALITHYLSRLGYKSVL